MTELYDWNPMPHIVEIKCPSCAKLATFEFAEVVKISLKKDVGCFEESKSFDYKVFQDSCGHKWHGAIYYAGLHGGSVDAINGLPEGYSPENWAHSQYLYRNHGLDIGSVRCSNCDTRKKYTLNWPNDSYFSIVHKGQLLWAFDRESTVELRDFIASSEREMFRNLNGVTFFFISLPYLKNRVLERKLLNN